MSTRRERAAQKPGRIWVGDGSARRPFMRGILVHSLMARGLSFDDAYRIANEVRDRLQGRRTVTRPELAAEVARLLGDHPDLAKAADPSLPSIQVTGPGRGSPFSKGFLSQSLLAAAIDPNDAFDVARGIERELMLRGVREISRRDLRRLAYEALQRRIGPESAERYLVWRHFHEPERPVILLLGGTAGSGKSSLAAEVAHRLGIHRTVSTDSIRQVMRIMLSPELMPAIHASSYEAQGVVGAGAVKGDPVVEGFHAQAATVSVGVRAMMDRSVSENTSVILEGVSIVPGLIGLESYEGMAHVVFLVVATLDPEAFRARFTARGRDALLRPTHRYLKNLDAILRIQDHFLELADEHNVPIVDNDSFDGSVLSIIRHVTETLRKSGNFDAADLL